MFYFLLISVQRASHHALHASPLLSMFNPRYMKHALFGQTWKPIVVYQIVQVCVLIFHECLENCDMKQENSTNTSKKVRFLMKTTIRLNILLKKCIPGKLHPPHQRRFPCTSERNLCL